MIKLLKNLIKRKEKDKRVLVIYEMSSLEGLERRSICEYSGLNKGDFYFLRNTTFSKIDYEFNFKPY